MMMTMWGRSASVRRGKIRRTGRDFLVESLEERTVLSQVAVGPALAAGAAEVAKPHTHAHPLAVAHAKAKAHSEMTITGLVINDVALSGNQLLANATLNGTIKGHAISLPLVIPVSLTPGTAASSTSSTSGGASPAAATATQVLNLSLGAVNLSLLGLNVHLGSTCNYGDTAPITATITAIPSGTTYTSGGTTYQGGLLGDVLSDVANLLNSGGALSSLGSELGTLETNLTTALNQVLGGLNSGNSAATGKTMAAPAGQHEVLDLDLNPINLDALGALVQTNNICLNITATKGPGNLLGNLLG